MTNTTEHYKWAKIELGRAESIANSDSGAIGATLAALDSRLRGIES